MRVIILLISSTSTLASGMCHLGNIKKSASLDIPKCKEYLVRIGHHEKNLGYNKEKSAILSKNEFRICLPADEKPKKTLQILNESGSHSANFQSTSKSNVYDYEVHHNIGMVGFEQSIREHTGIDISDVNDKTKKQKIIKNFNQEMELKANITNLKYQHYEMKNNIHLSAPTFYSTLNRKDLSEIVKWNIDSEKKISRNQLEKFIINRRKAFKNSPKFNSDCKVSNFGKNLFIRCFVVDQEISSSSTPKAYHFLVNKNFKILSRSSDGYSSYPFFKPYFSFTYKGINYQVFVKLSDGGIYTDVTIGFTHNDKFFVFTPAKQCKYLDPDLASC